MRKVWLAVSLSLLCGCSASKVYVAKSYASAGKIAILPISNETNDLDGPIYVRQLLYQTLTVRGFHALPTGPIDDELKVQGFTDGGQLRATTPQKIGEWTGADTLLYTTLENFDYITVGFYSQRHVKILARLVDARTGERLWEAEREGSTRVFVANKQEAERQFALQLAVKAVEKAAHTPLQLESKIAVGRLVSALPYRH